MFASLKHALRRGRGLHFETVALDYLTRQGLKPVTRNFHSRYGEIDLILSQTCGERRLIVFVEVRYRADSAFGSPVATITPQKRRKIIRTAQLFLQKHGLTDKVACRFDVIGITGDGKTPRCQWIKNAFQY